MEDLKDASSAPASVSLDSEHGAARAKRTMTDRTARSAVATRSPEPGWSSGTARSSGVGCDTPRTSSAHATSTALPDYLSPRADLQSSCQGCPGNASAAASSGCARGCCAHLAASGRSRMPSRRQLRWRRTRRPQPTPTGPCSQPQPQQPQPPQQHQHQQHQQRRQEEQEEQEEEQELWRGLVRRPRPSSQSARLVPCAPSSRSASSMHLKVEAQRSSLNQ